MVLPVSVVGAAVATTALVVAFSIRASAVVSDTCVIEFFIFLVLWPFPLLRFVTGVGCASELLGLPPPQ